MIELNCIPSFQLVQNRGRQPLLSKEPSSSICHQITFSWSLGDYTVPFGGWRRPEAVGIFATVSFLPWVRGGKPTKKKFEKGFPWELDIWWHLNQCYNIWQSKSQSFASDLSGAAFSCHFCSAMLASCHFCKYTAPGPLPLPPSGSKTPAPQMACQKFFSSISMYMWIFLELCVISFFSNAFLNTLGFQKKNHLHLNCAMKMAKMYFHVISWCRFFFSTLKRATPEPKVADPWSSTRVCTVVITTTLYYHKCLSLFVGY